VNTVEVVRASNDLPSVLVPWSPVVEINHQMQRLIAKPSKTCAWPDGRQQHVLLVIFGPFDLKISCRDVTVSEEPIHTS
jgi:hypothetical protein